MTIETVLAWSFARAVTVSAMALPFAFLIGCYLSNRAIGRRWRTAVAVAALAPLFVPDLLTGFTYRLTSMRLVHSAAATEVLYAALQLFRVCAFQTAVLLLLPPSAVTPESIYCWKLSPHRSRKNRWQYMRLLLSGPLRHPVFTWLAGVLVCFQEFESAAILQIESHPVAWTVWLFDAQAAGESMSILMGHVARAAVPQALLLTPVLLLLPGRARLTTAVGTHDVLTLPGWLRRIPHRLPTIGFAMAGILTLLIWPVVSAAGEVIGGLSSMLAERILATRILEILTSLVPIVIAAIISLRIAVRIRSAAKRWLLLILILPGLCGSLFISLILLKLFQTPVLRFLYDTWLPMIFGLVLFAMPRAVVLVVLLDELYPRTAVHSAELLLSTAASSVQQKARQIIWRLGTLRWWLATAILTHWCFWDVTVVLTLRPVRFEHIVTRLYNEMHYGRSELLVAGTLLAFVVPLAVFVFTAVIWQQAAGRSILRND